MRKAMKKIIILSLLFSCITLSKNAYASTSLEDIAKDSEEAILTLNGDLPRYNYKIRYEDIEDTEDRIVNANNELTYFEDGHLEDIIIRIDDAHKGLSYAELRYLVQHELIHIYAFNCCSLYDDIVNEGLTDLLNVYLLEKEGLPDPSADEDSPLYESIEQKEEMSEYLEKKNLEIEKVSKKFLRFFWNKKYFEKNFSEYKN